LTYTDTPAHCRFLHAADQEFWNQEFFAEDQADIDYQSEKEEEDVPDSDFFESESEPDDEEEQVAKEKKKKTLRAPGAPPGGSKPRPKPAPKPKPPAASASPSAAASDELPHSVIFEATYEAPSLRKSTRARMEVAQKEREQREQQAKATRRPQRQTEYRVLTQVINGLTDWGDGDSLMGHSLIDCKHG
jgi:vacuolar protein sorting-associated protein 72